MIRSIVAAVFLMACQNHDGKQTNLAIDSTSIPITQNDSIVIQNDTLLQKETFNFKPVNIKQVPVEIKLRNKDSFRLYVPEGFHLAVAAEGLKRLRFLSRSPDGRLFATDMFDRSDNNKGRVLIFENWNDSSKKFMSQTTFLDNQHNPNQVAFNDGYIYVAETHRLTRYAYQPGLSKPNDSGQVLIDLPAYGLGYKYGGWHLTRSIAFHHNKLYLSIGSSCNACIEQEQLRATVIEMDPDGKNIQYYARGLRNSVGLKWLADELWATGMGRDLIGPDKPEDLFQKIDRNGYYGWPFYFQYKQQVYNDDQFKDSARADWVKKPPVAFLGFKAHSAPLGFDYFKNFDDPVLQNSVLVCLHGSTSVWRQRGNAIVRVAAGNQYTEIVSGFLTGKTEADRHGRPCDILMKNNHSFFFTDDLNGILYYVWK